MFVKLVIVVSLVVFCNQLVDCLECYSCTDVDHVSDCNTVTQCPAGNMCQARFTSNKYTMGCVDQSLCSVMITSSSNFSSGSGSIIGRSVISPVQEGCAECCETGNCNRQLCQIQSNKCSDSGTINCALTGSVLNVCIDADHAKTACKKFCGLCEVDGKWSSWSEWTACSRSCENGTETRSRSCSDPAPANDGNDCPGASHEMRACVGSPCPVNGGWSRWSEWGGCSVSCGVGIQRRDRVCSSPYPSNAGSHCFGDSRDDQVCLPGACNDGGWSTWGVWESCSRTCDGGIQTRSRTCDNPSPSLLGQSCSGDTVETQQCALNACSDGHWSVWGSWGICSKTCGGGIQTRSRSCTNPPPSALGHYCTGDPSQVQQCSEKACADGHWSVWGSWGICSKTCGGGIQTRSRSCTNPPPSALGHYCTEDPLQVQQCSEKACDAIKIGFSVNHPASTSLYSDGIRFTTVVSNEGSGYNTTTGEFTCSVPGMYYFSVQLITASTSFTQCGIDKNGSKLQYTYITPYNSNYNSGTFTVYVHLTVGDIVSLRGCTAVTTMTEHSEFTGFLVVAD